MLHVINTWCVAHNLHTIAPWPLERTCWRQFVALRGDCWNLKLHLSMRLLLLLLLLLLSSSSSSLYYHHHHYHHYYYYHHHHHHHHHHHYYYYYIYCCHLSLVSLGQVLKLRCPALEADSWPLGHWGGQLLMEASHQQCHNSMRTFNCLSGTCLHTACTHIFWCNE